MIDKINFIEQQGTHSDTQSLLWLCQQAQDKPQISFESRWGDRVAKVDIHGERHLLNTENVSLTVINIESDTVRPEGISNPQSERTYIFQEGSPLKIGVIVTGENMQAELKFYSLENPGDTLVIPKGAMAGFEQSTGPCQLIAITNPPYKAENEFSTITPDINGKYRASWEFVSSAKKNKWQPDTGWSDSSFGKIAQILHQSIYNPESLSQLPVNKFCNFGDNADCLVRVSPQLKKLTVSEIVDHIGFALRRADYQQTLRPNAMENLTTLTKLGLTKIWTEGDRVEQAQRGVRIGISALRRTLNLDNKQLSYTGSKDKTRALGEIIQSSPDVSELVVIDDKISNLIKVQSWASENCPHLKLKLVHIAQGRANKHNQVIPENISTYPDLTTATKDLVTHCGSENHHRLILVDMDDTLTDDDIRFDIQAQAVEKQLLRAFSQ